MSSLKMTFSLASLFLIFALAFSATPVMAADGGPTVTITEYSGKADPNDSASANYVKSRTDYRLKFEFNKLVTGTIAEGNITVKTAEASGKLLTEPDDNGFGSDNIIAVTTGAGANKVWVVAFNLDTIDGDYSEAYLSIALAKDVVLGAAAGDPTEGLGNQAGSWNSSLVGGVLKATNYTFTASEDADDKATIETTGDDKGKIAANDTFNVKFTATDGSGSYLSLPGSRIQIKDAKGATITGITAAGSTNAVGNVYTVAINVGSAAVAPPIFIGVNPNWAKASPVGGLRIPPGAAPKPTEIMPVVAIELVDGSLDTDAKTFQVKFTYTKATDVGDGETAAAVPSTLAASDIALKKEDPADATMRIDSDAYVDGDIITLSPGKFVATVNYTFDALPVYIELADPTTVSNDDDDPVPSLKVGEGGTVPVDPIPPNAPGVPTGLTATADQAADTVTLSWTVPTDDGGSAITGYTITQTGAAAASYTSTTTSHTTPKLAAGDYSFAVAATNANGTGAKSTAVSATIDAAGPANNPPEFVAALKEPKIVIWKGHAYQTSNLPLAEDDEGDSISYSITPALPAGLALKSVDAQTRYIKGTATAASESTPYDFVATDNHGESVKLSFTITVLEPIVPTAPTAVMAMEEGDLRSTEANLKRTVNTNKVVVSWTEPVMDDTKDVYKDLSPPHNEIPFGSKITSYMVYRTDTDGSNPVTYPLAGATAIAADAETYTTPKALGRGGYSFKVAAVNDVGTGATSTDESAHLVIVADPPKQSTDLRASQVPDAPRSVTLNWLKPLDNGGLAIEGYLIYRTLVGGPTTEVKVGAGITHTMEGLASGRHVFRVAAFNGDGLGLKSEGTEFSVDVPTDPTNVAPTFGGKTIAKISATATQAVSAILPAATDPDGDDNAITYSLGATPALPTGVTFDASTRLLSGTPGAAMSAQAYTYTATDSAGATASLNFVIEVMAAPVDPTNVKPTFGNEKIDNITATVDTAIAGRTLPAATDPDGDDGDIVYTLSPNASAIGLSFTASTRFLSGTPSAAQQTTTYTYTATDAKGGTASLNFTIAVKAKVIITPPATGDLPATYADGATTITSGMIAANGFATVGSMHLPDLEAFFEIGGTIGLSNGDATDDKNSRTVVISEILWGLDLGAAATAQDQWQFIELYNTTNASINVAGWKLTFTEGNVVPASDIDQMSNRGRTGWDVDTGDTGKSGRVTGTTAVDLASAITPQNIVSMYRNIDYARVEKTDHNADATKNREEQLKGVPGGNGKGSWKASQRRSAYNRWIYDSKRAKHFKPVDILSPSAVAGTPFRINEIGNDTGSDNDWVELHNVTDSEQNLKNYALSQVTAKGTDTKLFDFKDEDRKVPAKGYVVISTRHPKMTDLAAGKDISVADDEEENRGASHLFVVKPVNLADSGKTLLILRNAHDKQGSGNNLIDVVGPGGFGDNSISTSLWPLTATGGPHGNVIDGGDEAFKAGFVYQRNGDNNGRGEKHFAVRGYTGVGYDRAAAATSANGGTPGYDNAAVKEKVADLSNAEVTFSEIMLDTGKDNGDRRNHLPQWIELYNSSMTQAVNTNGWKLHVENHNDVKTALDAVLTLGSMVIPPNQTILIVTNTGRVSDPDHFPSERVVNLWTTKAHRTALAMTSRTEKVFSTAGIYLKLTDKDNKLVDEFGNLDGDRRTREDLTSVWMIPMSDEDGRRSSLIRKYSGGDIEATGTKEDAWVLANDTNLAFAISPTYFGDPDDFGTPGQRGGGPLPVSLSKFRPERQDDGAIVVRWITESELNNAGFNILRSETRNGEFTKVHFEAGEGTTTERNAYEWKDTSAKPNVVYYYQIQDVSLDGEVTTLRQSRLKGDVSADGKLTTTWGKIKALQ